MNDHSPRPAAAAIIPAGGLGRRMGQALPKQFCPLAGVPLLIHTLRCFEETPAIAEVVLVVPAEHLVMARELVASYRLAKVIRIVEGGRLRQDSVRAGLAALSANIEFAVVHDAARPLVTPAIIDRCLAAAIETGAALAAIPVKDTIKAVSPGRTVESTLDRDRLWQAQTPQIVRVDLLAQAFAAAEVDGFAGTDESSLLEHRGIPMAVVTGSERNIKITTPEDLLIAEALLMNDQKDKTKTGGAAGIRSGHGYDAHRLVAGRPLILGGVTVPHALGLLGHSDADVLTHALMDAILGALALGDLGQHFPDSDARYAGANSLRLLEHVVSLAWERGYRLVNADLTVIAEKPKLAPHIAAMRANLASICRVEMEAVGVKATTTEGLGFAGREEGIAAHAVVLLARQS